VSWFYGKKIEKKAKDKFIEIVLNLFIKGFNKFRNDLTAMIGPKIAKHFLFNIFRALWVVITPTIVLVFYLNIFLFVFVGYNYYIFD
jgi:hypothetical protein